MPAATDAQAIATAVQAEIERQAAAGFAAMTELELEAAIAKLEEQLEKAKVALKAAAPAVVAEKAADPNSLPPLPWGGLFRGDTPMVDGPKVRKYVDETMSKRIMIIDGAMGTSASGGGGFLSQRLGTRHIHHARLKVLILRVMLTTTSIMIINGAMGNANNNIQPRMNGGKGGVGWLECVVL
ncbi:hypothetical protein T492DRAFT_836942 [Pavlovales sp. CCMP2436]|nr:hypothetical protein T492DRAFT_836942 [Pavlovales sp. CCMP2436]